MNTTNSETCEPDRHVQNSKLVFNTLVTLKKPIPLLLIPKIGSSSLVPVPFLVAHSGLDRAARRADRPRRWLFFGGDDGYIGMERGYHGDSIISWDIQNHLDMISV